jgi:all-trans-8'-apo-beta-carotenal 15,15'-oxygenase
MADHRFIHREPQEVRGAALTVVEGAIPPALRGTLLRNGPGLQRAGQTPVHFLDGYATVAAAHFADGRATCHVRHVALPLRDQEHKAGQLVGRRPFTNRPGGAWANLFRLTLSTGAAHDVYTWGGAVVAADVAGHFLLDRTTLDTVGPAPLNALGGGLSQLSPMPRLDPVTGHLVAYVMTPGMAGSDTVTFLEFDGKWQEQRRLKRSLGVKGALLHDLTTTENYYLVAQFGLLDVAAAALGRGVVLDAVRLPSGAARILAVPRRGDGPVRSMPLPEGYQAFHLANAYEEAGKLVVDTTCYEGGLDFDPLNPPGLGRGPRPGAAPARGPFLARHTLELSTGAHHMSVHAQAAGEAPSVREELSGRRHRYAYVSAQGTRGDEPVDNAYYWYHGLAKLDCDAGTTVDLWDAGPRVYVTAPQFVPRGAAEDEGWLLAWTCDTARECGELVILDAQALARGPVARLALPGALPPASHVTWLPA